MMQFDGERVLANVRQATTEDLLDRATVYRNGMEPEALEMIEAELEARGVGTGEIEAHARERNQEMILLPDGTAKSCSFCRRPAVGKAWGWNRGNGGTVAAGWVWLLAGPLAWLSLMFPIFPRFFYYCEEHRPNQKVEERVDPVD